MQLQPKPLMAVWAILVFLAMDSVYVAKGAKQEDANPHDSVNPSHLSFYTGPVKYGTGEGRYRDHTYDKKGYDEGTRDHVTDNQPDTSQACSDQYLLVQAVGQPESVNGIPNTVVGVPAPNHSKCHPAGAAMLFWGTVRYNEVVDFCRRHWSSHPTQSSMSGKTMASSPVKINALINGTANGGWASELFSTTLNVYEAYGCPKDPAQTTHMEFLMQIPTDRKVLVTCYPGASQDGCGVWLLGEDVDDIYSSLNTQAYQASAMPAQHMNQTLEDPVALSPSWEQSHSGMAGSERSLLASANEGCVDGLVKAGLPCLTAAPALVACAFGGPATLALCAGVAGGVCAGAACGLGVAKAKGCFPGDATVVLRSGEEQLMSHLKVGDQVAVLDSTGSVQFEAIYAFGHDDPKAVSTFVRLSTAGGNTLELTGLHFVPTYTGAQSSLVYKRAKDVTVGDKILTLPHSAGTASEFQQVTGVEVVTKRGLFNPLTMSGTILVNGVLASSHSEWFADTTFDTLGVPHLLPMFYQVVLAPVRTLYHVMGKDMYAALYAWLDRHLGVAQAGTQHGGVVFAVGAACMAVSICTITKSAVFKGHKTKS